MKNERPERPALQRLAAKAAYVGAGIGAGLLASVLVRPAPEVSEPASHDIAAVTASEVQRARSGPSDLARRNAKELVRLRELLELRDEPFEASPDEAVETELPETIDLSPEELERQHAQLFEAWRGKIEGFANEPVDGAWASVAEAKIADQVAVLLEVDADFDYLGTTCKSDHCATSVRFANFGAARMGAKRLLHQNYKVGCGTEIMLPPPRDAEQPYDATLMHDCWDQSPRSDE